MSDKYVNLTEEYIKVCTRLQNEQPPRKLYTEGT